MENPSNIQLELYLIARLALNSCRKDLLGLACQLPLEPCPPDPGRCVDYAFADGHGVYRLYGVVVHHRSLVCSSPRRRLEKPGSLETRGESTLVHLSRKTKSSRRTKRPDFRLGTQQTGSLVMEIFEGSRGLYVSELLRRTGIHEFEEFPFAPHSNSFSLWHSAWCVCPCCTATTRHKRSAGT